MDVDLAPTSYALLGLLALRPWTTYELAQQAQRSLRLMWPVSERQLYEHPKVLVQNRLATATRENTGGRGRTVYKITAKGRRALRAWLDDPSGEALTIRSETLLRIFFCDHAEHTDVLLRQIERLRASVIRGRNRQVDLYEYDMAHGGPPFPERSHINAIVSRLQLDIADAIARWADWAGEEIERWPEDLTLPDHVDDLLARAFARPSSPGVDASPGGSGRIPSSQGEAEPVTERPLPDLGSGSAPR